MAKIKGRPENPIDWDLVDSLLGIQCTQAEICQVIGISNDTLARRCKSDKNLTYAEYSDQKGANGRTSLRRKQYEVAMSGDRVMLIWLGKQWLGQSEKIENKHHFSTDLAERIAKARKRRSG